MKKLPKIFKKNITPISHNKEYCYVLEKRPVKEELDELFNSLGPIYRKKVIIKTKDREIETYILKRYNGIVKTINNDIFKESEIESVTRI